ncbi:hypothetical protein B0T21DRAFT_286587 [Apiosordaria backusii]|uniref:Uncharacterized protein n=1 Tax=Apiosordaria backusii TaxID=314023 RepID=A0AA40BMF8_9PEZI|nr:hypothetical protein B0T21DRAFT_286587 [Apiosordaria backusii]
MTTATPARPVFPQEIWWMVAQELATICDFGTLFTCARLSQGLANLALPQLYGIHDQSPAINAHILDVETSVCLWRSIIASSLGKTRYPYCCWIKSLKLGNLHSHLEDLSRTNPGLKARFFKAPLQKFMIKLRGQQLNLDGIVIEVANSLTSYIRTAADQADKRVALTTLEGWHLPTAHLASWVSNLSCLTCLVVRDGSVLTADVARALRANCPSFKDLECYFCQGTEIDEELAGFFQDLEPQTLECFTVLSLNNLGKKTFKALGAHSKSLKRLDLFSLEPSALASLHELHHCVAIEELSLEGNYMAQAYHWQEENKSAFSEVVDWLIQCVSLKELDMILVPNSTVLLSELADPKLTIFELTSLTLKLNELDNEAFYGFIKRQESLRQLTLRFVDDEILEGWPDRNDVFAEALLHLSDLRELDTNELFTAENINLMAQCGLDSLEDIVLNGDMIDDEFFLNLLGFEHLKSLSIFGPSCVTGPSICRFIDLLSTRDSSEAHEGLQISISSQVWELQLGEEMEKTISEMIKEKFGGTFDITYRPDPDELHESDFSD